MSAEYTEPRTRGRPRAFDREAALSEATTLFWRKGYEATSILDLTQAMGIGSPSLYAAFGSKEALYAEALRHYVEQNAAVVWAGFQSAVTAREAVWQLLLDSALALPGRGDGLPLGCMVTLSSVADQGHERLGDLVRRARSETLSRLNARLSKGVADGEIGPDIDIHALSRFVQTIQNGMSILARDGASRSELKAVAELAMAAWDAGTPG